MVLGYRLEGLERLEVKVLGLDLVAIHAHDPSKLGGRTMTTTTTTTTATTTTTTTTTTTIY